MGRKQQNVPRTVWGECSAVGRICEGQPCAALQNRAILLEYYGMFTVEALIECSIPLQPFPYCGMNDSPCISFELQDTEFLYGQSSETKSLR
jgi:hypothetical protein